MDKLFKFLLKTAFWVGLIGLGAYGVQRKQLDEKVLRGFEKYFRAMIGQEPLA